MEKDIISPCFLESYSPSHIDTLRVLKGPRWNTEKGIIFISLINNNIKVFIYVLAIGYLISELDLQDFVILYYLFS